MKTQGRIYQIEVRAGTTAPRCGKRVLSSRSRAHIHPLSSRLEYIIYLMSLFECLTVSQTNYFHNRILYSHHHQINVFLTVLSIQFLKQKILRVIPKSFLCLTLDIQSNRKCWLYFQQITHVLSVHLYSHHSRPRNIISLLDPYKSLNLIFFLSFPHIYSECMRRVFRDFLM